MSIKELERLHPDVFARYHERQRLLERNAMLGGLLGACAIAIVGAIVIWVTQ